MTLLEWGLQILLLAMLGAAIPFALRLERALREIRADRSAMSATAPQSPPPRPAFGSATA